MNSLLDETGCVLFLDRRQSCVSINETQVFVKRESEFACHWIIAHNVDGEYWNIDALGHLLQPQYGETEFHCAPELEVLSSFRTSLVVVLQEPVRLPVRIWAVRRSDDRQGGCQFARIPDPAPAWIHDAQCAAVRQGHRGQLFPKEVAAVRVCEPKHCGCENLALQSFPCKIPRVRHDGELTTPAGRVELIPGSAPSLHPCEARMEGDFGGLGCRRTPDPSRPPNLS